MLLSALVAEALLRVRNPIELPVRGKEIVLPVNRRFVWQSPENSKLDRTLHLTSNSLGFRGADPPSDFEGALTVVAIGGSTTECKLLDDEKTWCARLEQRLAQSFDRVWLDNAGFDGHSTFGHLILLQQVVMELKPDCALFLVGINDVGRGDLSEYDQGARPENQPWTVRAIASSELLSSLQVLYRTYMAFDLGLCHDVELDLARLSRVDLAAEPVEAVLAEHRERFLEPYEKRLLRIVAACRVAGIEPVLVTQPALFGDAVDAATGIHIGELEVEGGHSASTSWRVLELYNDVTRRVGCDKRVLVIDLAARLAKDSSLYYDWVHYTNHGAERVAEIVAAELAPFLKAHPEMQRRP